MSHSENQAFLMAIASVSLETSSLDSDLEALLREAVTKGLSPQEVMVELLTQI